LNSLDPLFKDLHWHNKALFSFPNSSFIDSLKLLLPYFMKKLLQTCNIIKRRFSKFELSKNFVNKYKNEKPPFGFNGLGEFVYKRTYSRLKEDNKQEEWYETVERVCNGTFTMQKEWIFQNNLNWNENEIQDTAKKMYKKIFEMKFLPPGRGLWAMGSKLTEDKKLYAACNIFTKN
jgi:ribonucleoside-triphosphate reductase